MKKPLLCTLILALVFAQLAFSQGLANPTPFIAFSNGVLPSTAPGSSTGWSIEDAFANLDFVDPIWLAQIPDPSNSGPVRLLVAGKNGKIFRFNKDPGTYGDNSIDQADLVTVLDWSANTQTGEDMGFYKLVFHPNFGQTGLTGANDVFVCYNAIPKDNSGTTLAGAGINDSYWRVSRFKWNHTIGAIDLTSNVGGPGKPEQVLINQYDPQQWHGGGAMFFDNEGFLNFSVGDGEFDYWHANENGPIDGGFFGGIFRIDVDNNPAKSHAIRRQPVDIPATATGDLPADPAHALPAGWPASSTQGYGIPNTNPWQDVGGSILEEFVVHGLRSPHTVSYDPVENEMWCGDVGGGAYEELSRLTLGDNAQWPIREGDHGGNQPLGAIGTWTPPVIDYGHGGTSINGVTLNGAAIIGGMRYRGTKWSATFDGNVVLFGDITTGKIWTITLDGSTGNPVINATTGDPEVNLIADQGIKNGGKYGLANFCTDDEGEIYLMELNGQNNPGGKIKKLVTAGIAQEPPLYLSQLTGLFSNVATLTTASGVIPYDVATPLWSDAAHKKRWIALPNNGSHNTPAEKIAFNDEYNWVFPEGTVLIKHFELDTDLDPAIETIRRLETRLIVCTANGGKYGITYKWNAAGTDAVRMGGADPLNEPDGVAEPIPMYNNGVPTTAQNWDFPSRNQCVQCHNTTSGQALGVRTTQLNRDYHYPSTGITSNQLLTFNSLGMFDRTLTPTQLANFIASRPIDDETAPLEHRVRSYFDSNCSHCHQPGGTIPYFDARLGTPLNLQGIINQSLSGHYEFPGGATGRYVKPGDLANSVMHFRASNVGNSNAMPPLAKNLADQDAVAMLANYIGSIDNAEFTVTAPAKARFVRLTGLSEVNGAEWTSVAELAVLDGSGNPIPGITVVDFDSQAGGAEAAASAVDGNINSHWHTPYGGGTTVHPHYITVDLGSLREISGYKYTPRQGNQNGRIAAYQVHYTTESSFSTNNWALMDSGTWTNDAAVKTFGDDPAETIIGIRKARCEIAGPANLPGGGASIKVTIAFDSDVNDFTAGDLQLAGGTVTSLRGSGYYYVATITPTQTAVSVQVPANVANNNLLGNLASNPIQIGDDIFGPIASFTGVPAGGLISGPVTLGIAFDEVPTGFSAGSLSATNANLSGLSGSGLSYSILVTPVAEGSISVTLNKAGITDSLSNAMPNSVTANLTYSSQILLAEAEGGTLAGNMVIVNDGSASGGSYIGLSNDGGTPEIFNPANSATYTFILPTSGDWILEGLIRAADTSTNSLWVKVDSGPVYLWDTHVSATFQWDQLNSVPSSSVTLIGPGISNGGFDLLGGIASTAKATHWDTDPDGNVDNWTFLAGPPGDSGTEMDGANRIAFFQAGNHAFNITDTPHIIATGDVINFSYEDDGGGNVDVQLGAWNGNTTTPGVTLFGTQSVSSGNGTYNGVQYTVTSGDTGLLGKTLTLVAGSTGQFYPHLDNVVLTVASNLPPIDPLVLDLAAGVHTVTVYGREVGTQLDSLRFVESFAPATTVGLTAPATVISGFNLNVAVTFSASVTGLTTSDFNITGATATSLTGSGSSYTLTVTPTGPTVGVTLPVNSVVQGNSTSNTVTIAVNPPYITQVEAEGGALAGGMVSVSDPGASNGSSIWLPNGTAPGNENAFNPANSATYTFNLPYAGNWILEGRLRSDSASSNSLWVKVDAGSTYNWNTNEGHVGDLAYHWDQLSSISSSSGPTTLIDATTRNGSFELLGVAPGAGNGAKATHWDTDADGDVTYWTNFPGLSVAASDNSGTETNAGIATHGIKVAFLENGNAAYNMTTYVIQAGDVFTFLWDARNGAAHNVSLIYDNGGTPTAVGVPVASTTTGLNKTGTYTVAAADACIGKTIGVRLASTGNYPNLDNVRLSVIPATTSPVDPVILNLTAGTHTVTVYAQEDGTRLDALRLVPVGGTPATITLTAPDVVVGSGNVNVAVAFSTAVTGLASGDFTVSGAAIAGITGSGANYTLTLMPTASSVSVTLPLDSVVEGNEVSNTEVITVRTTFEQWVIDNGLGTITYGSDGDHDGIPALSEFLLNLNPNASGVPIFDPAGSPTGLPKVTRQDGRLRIDFPHNAAAVAAGYHYIGQFSSDLQTWESIETGTLVPMNSAWDHMTIEDPVASPLPQNRHARLKLVSP